MQQPLVALTCCSAHIHAAQGRNDKYRVQNKVQDPDNPQVYLDVAIGSDYGEGAIWQAFTHHSRLLVC